jgi:hypothetical protein
MGVVFGSPPSPPVSQPQVLWTGLDMTWTGWDGSVWDLSNPETGTVMMPGVRGFNMPPITHYLTPRATVPGARWRGHSVDVREVFWPLQVYSDAGSTAWIVRDRAFWKTMRPDKTGTWTVIQPNGVKRTLTLRFQDDGSQQYDTDPAIVGWTNYGITLAAEDPYWAGPTETGTWTQGTPSGFFATGSATLKISPGVTLATATLNNPGDVETWPVWEVHGPVDNASVGLNGRIINVPFAVPAGQVLTINTSPRVQTAMLNGVDRTADLGTVDFAPLPADQTTALSLNMTGTGTVKAHITPLYLRAW